MNISIHSDRKDTHVAVSLYVAAMQIAGLHLTHPDEADLVINVDSVHNSGLVRGKKTAYYELDDNLHQGKNTTLYDVDLLYIVTKENLPLYPKGSRWLPVAMEPTIHYHWPFPETKDFVFIGQYNSPSYEFRRQVIGTLSQHFDGILDHCQIQDYPKFLSQAKIRVNVNPRFDAKPPLIITRFYESMGIGFTMNDWHASMDEIATDGTHYVSFSSIGEAVDKMRFYLQNDELRTKIGEAGKQHVLSNHTWKHRLMTILQDYAKL